MLERAHLTMKLDSCPGSKFSALSGFSKVETDISFTMAPAAIRATTFAYQSFYLAVFPRAFVSRFPLMPKLLQIGAG